MVRLILGVIAITFAVPLCAAEPTGDTYPDLSDPKAAAFSLALAVVTGDEPVAKQIYIGDDQEFKELLERMVALKKSREKLSKTAVAHFGKNAVTMANLDSDVRIKDARLSEIVSISKVTLNGNFATLTPTEKDYESLSVRLKKVDNEWRVTDFPHLPLIRYYASLSAEVSDEVAAEIEQGKYQKAYEVFPAFIAKVRSKMKATSEKKLPPGQSTAGKNR
jgi:hypothetical protein